MEKEIDKILKVESKIAADKKKALEKASALKSQSEKELALIEKEIKNSHRERIQDELIQFRGTLDKENIKKLEEYEERIITFDRLDPKVIESVIEKLNDKICHSEF